ncbi:hypothetical protein [Actinomarinicola tropica]|uniref:Uncharacterized protein n=1 Tax=Actinomarinicola tropica TaxID=2789776 RepID=A0A5Q2RL06_9ACTN|nr:hypothetical protein [Actinomarinicola tropica]QGG94540.1 hypothetical protein GH723_05145 [Actinomarinicola tropica]
MEIRFWTDDKRRSCTWEAVRSSGTRLRGPTMAAGGDVPHDLATLVVEAALHIEHGFWGCLAEGATFRGISRRRTDRGKGVIRAHLADLDAAEERVNAEHFGWRRGDTVEAGDALDDALDAWRVLQPGDELVLHWPPPEWSARSRPRTGRRAQTGRA